MHPISLYTLTLPILGALCSPAPPAEKADLLPPTTTLSGSAIPTHSSTNIDTAKLNATRPTRDDPSTWIWLDLPIIPGPYDPHKTPDEAMLANSKRQGFYHTCAITGNDDGGGLHARCRTVSGSIRDTYLNMNSCMANRDGWLVWADNGLFSGTCNPNFWQSLPCGAITILVSDDEYHACCRDIGGGWNKSFLNLNERLSNWDGHLACFNNVGV